MDEISSEQARSIARDLLRLSKDSAKLEVDRVMEPGEWGRIAAYITGPTRIEDCWLVVLRRREIDAVRSTDIMLIDRASGHLVYQGGAGDEG